jgi:hypothetical protein
LNGFEISFPFELLAIWSVVLPQEIGNDDELLVIEI